MNKFGAITLPIAAPVAGAAAADPFLDYALDFFKTYLNTYGLAAWQAVAPGGVPVKSVRPHDPENCVFNERELPAIYMWRGGGERVEWMAEDYLVSKDQVRVLWVFPNATQEIQHLRDPIINGLLKALSVSFELGRDPCWVVSGDTDPQAPGSGSVFMRWAGALSLYMSKWQQKLLIINTNTEPRKYSAIEAQLDLEEILDRDVGDFYDLTRLDQTILTNGTMVAGQDVFQ